MVMEDLANRQQWNDTFECIFKRFDVEDTGGISMHGGAKSIDIATLLVRTDHLTRQLNKLTGRVSTKKLQQPRRERYQRMTTTTTNGTFDTSGTNGNSVTL